MPRAIGPGRGWPFAPQLLLALAYWGQDTSRKALDALLAVVRFAEPEDMPRPFLDCGARLIPLLAFVARAGSLSVAQQRFVTNLLDALRTAHPDAPPPAAADLDRRAAAATISPRGSLGCSRPSPSPCEWPAARRCRSRARGPVAGPAVGRG